MVGTGMALEQVVVINEALCGFCSAVGSRRLFHGEKELKSAVAARLCCSQPAPWQAIAISSPLGQIQP